MWWQNDISELFNLGIFRFSAEQRMACPTTYIQKNKIEHLYFVYFGHLNFVGFGRIHYPNNGIKSWVCVAFSAQRW